MRRESVGLPFGGLFVLRKVHLYIGIVGESLCPVIVQHDVTNLVSKDKARHWLARFRQSPYLVVNVQGKWSIFHVCGLLRPRTFMNSMCSFSDRFSQSTRRTKSAMLK